MANKHPQADEPIDCTQHAVVTGTTCLKEKDDKADPSLNALESQASVRHVDDTAIPDEDVNVRYVSPGFKGMLQSPYVTLCATIARLGGFLFGYDQGVISIILVMPQFLDRFGEVDDSAPGSGLWKGLMTAMIQLGALIGALNQGWVTERYSRKYSIVFAVVILVAGTAVQTASADYAMLTASRFVGGVGVGMLSMVVPMYIAELSPPEIRGTLLVLEEFSIVVGIVVAYYITFGTRHIPGEWSWRLPFMLQIFPSVFLGVAMFFLPFSPRWLASKGRDEEALQTLCRLRRVGRDDARVRAECYDIRAEVRFHREVAEARHGDLVLPGRGWWSAVKLEMASFADCFSREYRKRTVVGAGLAFFQQFVGINALIYYAPTLFQTMGIEYEMQLVLAGVLNVTQLVGVATSLWTMDRFGRRPLIHLGSAGMAACHLIMAVLVGLYNDSWDENRDKGWVSVAFLFAFMLIFGMTWGPVPWAMPSEIFPSSIRAKGVALSTASIWFNNFVIGLITPPLIQSTNGFGAYAFFAVWCLASLVFGWFCVPETKGKSLEAMDAVFGDHVGSHDRRRKKEIMERLRSQEAGT